MGVALGRHAVGDLAGARNIRRRQASDGQHYVIITDVLYEKNHVPHHRNIYTSLFTKIYLPFHLCGFYDNNSNSSSAKGRRCTDTNLA